MKSGLPGIRCGNGFMERFSDWKMAALSILPDRPDGYFSLRTTIYGLTKWKRHARVICPSCQSVAPGVVDRDPKSKAESAGLVPHEGRFAVVTNVGGGMR